MTKLQDTIDNVRYLVAQGLTVQEISNFLNISPEFVQQQIKPLKNGDFDFDSYDRDDF